MRAHIPSGLRAGLLAAALAATSFAAALTAEPVGSSPPGSSAARSGLSVELIALGRELETAQARLGAIRTRTGQLRRERVALTRRIAIARRSLAFSRRQLAELVGVIYQSDEIDPLAVLLGAESLDDALAHLDGLDLAAAQARLGIVKARTAARRYATLGRQLSDRLAEARRLEAGAARQVAAVQRARRERAALLERLVAEQRAVARRAARAPAPVASAAADPVAEKRDVGVPLVSQAPGARRLTVVATGYSLRGTTASGAPTSWGIVAVDPSVIPLGTRLLVEGYGDGVAADTGSAILGARIDLWFPTRAEALAWGTRTVTVTLR